MSDSSDPRSINGDEDTDCVVLARILGTCLERARDRLRILQVRLREDFEFAQTLTILPRLNGFCRSMSLVEHTRNLREALRFCLHLMSLIEGDCNACPSILHSVRHLHDQVSESLKNLCIYPDHPTFVVSVEPTDSEQQWMNALKEITADLINSIQTESR